MLSIPASKSLWPFSPQSIPGLALWLDAADASSVTLSGSEVTAWRDKSGLGNNMSVSGTVNYVSNKMTFSYGGIMTSANYTTITASVSTVFVVFQTINSPYDPGMMFACSDLGGGDTSIRFYPNIQNIGNGDPNDLGYTYGDDGTGQYYANGTLNGNNTVTVTAGVNIIGAVVNRTGSTLFTLSSSFSSRYFVGDIQEVIVYTGPITASERQQVEGYLGWKWGIQFLLPPTHPYSPSNSFQPTNIAGCNLWLDAADPNSVILSDPNDPASFITQWNDKSGNGNDMYVELGDIFYTTSPQRSLHFVTEPLMRTINNIDVNTSTSVFIVLQVTTVSNLGNTLEFTDLSSGEGYFSIRYSAPTNLTNGDGHDIGYPSGYYVNGTLYSNSAITVPFGYNIVNTTNTTQLGNTRVSLSTTFSGRYFYGNVQEVIIYTTAITSTQRQQVQAYLSQKWNIPLSFPIVTIGNSPYNRIFQPVDIPGCQLWLDAADTSANSITFSSGTTVSAWLDKSGNGNNGTANTGVEWVSNGMGTNLPAMTFTNIETFIGNISITGPTMTVFSVISMSGSSNVVGRMISFAAPNENDYNNPAYVGIMRLADNNMGPNRNGNWPLIYFSYDTPTLLSTWYDGAYANISANGDIYSSSSPSSGNFTISSYAVASNTNLGDGNGYFYGYISELIVYNFSLSLSQRQQIEAYLAWKWGLRANLPVTHSGYILPSFSTAFTPKSISGLQMWLDATDPNATGIVPADGTTVSVWNDKSGNNYNATVAAGKIAGTYSTANKAVNFAASNTGYATSYTANPSTETMFVVFNNPSPSGNNNMVIGGPQGARSLSGGFAGGGAGVGACSYLNNEVAWSGMASMPAGTYTSGTTVIITGQVNGATTSISQNGGTIYSNTTAYPFIAGTTTYLGTDYYYSAYYYIGYEMEVIFYNSLLSLSQRQQVEGYLAWKWGLQNNLPSTHAYKKFRP